MPAGKLNDPLLSRRLVSNIGDVYPQIRLSTLCASSRRKMLIRIVTLEYFQVMEDF